MGEERQKSGPAPGAPALDRAGGHIEDPGGLGDGVALHVDEDEGRALIGGKGAQGFQELPVHIVALGGGRGRLVRLQELFQALGVVDGGGLPGGRFPGAVEAGVHRDPVQPGRDGRLSAEGVGSTVGGDQRVLNSVRGFLTVPQGAQGNGPQAITVPPH